MPRQITAPIVGQPKKFPLRLPDDLAADLYAFCEATGAFHTKVICKAVRRYIDQELRTNEGVRVEFKIERERIEESRRRPKGVIRLLNPNSGPKKETAPTKKKSPTNSDRRRPPPPHKGD